MVNAWPNNYDKTIIFKKISIQKILKYILKQPKFFKIWYNSYYDIFESQELF